MITTSLNDLPEESVSHNPEIKKKVMLRFGDLPHLTNFSQARFAPGQTSPAHAHQDMCEVFFVEAGAGIISINGEEYPLLPGNCIAIELGEVHEIVNNGTTELVLTYFGLRVEAGER
ncbi:cupin domain-containing protein [Nostoc sp. UHCC 0870]|jgi:quercetin dioxygenase-like cupin family protein|uniref:cupin domain-containing protein n=1 Tax=Nostoc sp. UHCC 0870 TaxID=2914041 RepID=UPI001EDFE3FE|nr:cupin domain-containing protein [Nostoc sp. UHCC 0870]UKO97213.1 cupin domain-containing protein [Nostoc sp. UHCC 0870]